MKIRETILELEKFIDKWTANRPAPRDEYLKAKSNLQSVGDKIQGMEEKLKKPEVPPDIQEELKGLEKHLSHYASKKNCPDFGIRKRNQKALGRFYTVREWVKGHNKIIESWKKEEILWTEEISRLHKKLEAKEKALASFQMDVSLSELERNGYKGG